MKRINLSILSLTAIATVIGLSGCLAETEGIAPPVDQLVFPVGVAVTNDADHLLVVNSNFDLRYNNGTLMALSLAGLNGAGNTTSSNPKVSFDPTSGVYIVDGDLDSFCDPGGYEGYCHIDVGRSGLEEETIPLGAYASDLQLTADGRWAVVPVRGESALMVVEVDQDGDDLLYCSDGSGECDSSHRVTSNDAANLPIEPFTVATMDYAVPVLDDNGVQTGTVTETLGFSTHLAGGEVSLFSIATAADGKRSTLNANLISVIDGVVEGASGIATNPFKQDIYVAGRRDPNPHVAVLRVLTDLESGGSYLNNPWFSQAATIPIAAEVYGGTEARSIAVSGDGKEAYVLTQSPPALMKLNLETYETVDLVTVCAEPTRVKTWTDEGDPDNPDDDENFAFVLCFITGQMYVVRTDLMIATVRVTGQGPQDITFDKKRRLAYVANFSESTVTMYQAYPPFNQITVRSAQDSDVSKVIRIGEPAAPEEQ